MKQFNISEDPQRYVAYYHNQAGGYLPGFSGASSMYGGARGFIQRSFSNGYASIEKKELVLLNHI